MPSCVMRFCRNYSSKTSRNQGITYHSFPLNKHKRIEWVNIVRKQRSEEDWQPNNSTKICCIHFRNEDKYTSKKGLTLLKKTALPILENQNQTGRNIRKVKIENVEFLENPSTSLAGGATSTTVKQEDVVDIHTSLNIKIKIENIDADDPLQTPRCASPSGLSDIGSSDLEDALDTPAFLKKQLKEAKEVNEGLKMKLKEREDFCKKYYKKIRALQNANKRLSEKNVTLKQVLTKMKRKLLKRNSDGKEESNDRESKH